MKKIFLTVVIVLVTATAAMADASNGVPSPYDGRRVHSPIIGNANGWIREKIRVYWIPQIIAEPQSFRTRKYGTPVGYCKPIKRSSGGNIGRFLGWGFASTCR